MSTPNIEFPCFLGQPHRLDQKSSGIILQMRVAQHRRSSRLNRTCRTSALLCSLIAVALLPRADTALADSTQILDFSGSTEIIPPRFAVSPDLDSTPRRITISGTKLLIPLIASAEQSQYGRLVTLIELVNISDSDAEVSFDLRDASGNPLEMPFYNVSCPACPAIALSSHLTTLKARAPM